MTSLNKSRKRILKAVLNAHSFTQTLKRIVHGWIEKSGTNMILISFPLCFPYKKESHAGLEGQSN